MNLHLHCRHRHSTSANEIVCLRMQTSLNFPRGHTQHLLSRCMALLRDFIAFETRERARGCLEGSGVDWARLITVNVAAPDDELVVVAEGASG